MLKRFLLKRFLLFAGDNYYPRGGWDDFRGSYDSLEEALAAPRHNDNWWHVVDSHLGTVVKGSP